jgi:hypothetical protein
MRIRLLVGILLVALAALAGDKSQRLNIKTGLWENTMTISQQGKMPLPPEMLDRLSPEQRARMEARMKAQPDDHTHTFTKKSCITEHDLDNETIFSKPPAEGCTRQVVKFTSTYAEVHYVCAMQDAKGEGTVKVQVLNPENVKGSGQIHAVAYGQPINTNSSFAAKWLGSDCGKVQ